MNCFCFGSVPGKYSIAHIYTDVWDQDDSPFCLPFAAAHMVTMIYRMMHPKYENLRLSPQNLINARCNNIRSLNTYFCEERNGLYDIHTQQMLLMPIRDPHQIIGKIYRIERLTLHSGEENIVAALVENFCQGIQYPILGRCEMFDISREDVIDATYMKPFVRKTVLQPNQNPMSHYVLITGIFIVSVIPLKINVEFKNSYSRRWGREGFCWVTSDFFKSITVPSMTNNN